MQLMQPINRLKEKISFYSVTDLLCAQGGPSGGEAGDETKINNIIYNFNYKRCDTSTHNMIMSHKKQQSLMSHVCDIRPLRSSECVLSITKHYKCL